MSIPSFTSSSAVVAGCSVCVCILTWVRWNPQVVSSCISLIVKNDTLFEIKFTHFSFPHRELSDHNQSPSLKLGYLYPWMIFFFNLDINLCSWQRFSPTIWTFSSFNSFICSTEAFECYAATFANGGFNPWAKVLPSTYAIQGIAYVLFQQFQHFSIHLEIFDPLGIFFVHGNKYGVNLCIYMWAFSLSQHL